MSVIIPLLTQGPRKGDYLKKVSLFLCGYIMLTGCGGLSLGFKELSPFSFLPHQAMQAGHFSLSDHLIIFKPMEFHSTPALSLVVNPIIEPIDELLFSQSSSAAEPSSESPKEISWGLASSQKMDAYSSQCAVASLSFEPSYSSIYQDEKERFLDFEKAPIAPHLNDGAPREAKADLPPVIKPTEADSIRVDAAEIFFDLFADYDLLPPLDKYLETDLAAVSLFLAARPQVLIYGPDPQEILFAQSLPSFPLILNERVTEFIHYFQNKADDFFSRGLARSQAYAHMMKEILRKKNLPEELFYLALIESGFNPKALSRAKASGIWQFMAQTARRFGLTVNKWVDERRDPEKSTYAAAEYLRNLYEMFNCWNLAAASYNAGEGKVLRAMKKANSQDFWEISRHRYLKKETKRYVPMFHAAVLIAKNPQKYGFSTLAYYPPLLYDKVLVPPATSLSKIAKAAETDLATIQELNPAITRGKTPPNIAEFEIRIPQGKKEVFERNFSFLKSLNGKVHTVKSGETLSMIAKRYNVELEDLRQRNSLSPKNQIKPGMKIIVPQ